MTQEKLDDRGKKIKEYSTAVTLGHIDSILSKREEIMAFSEDELERFSVILNSTKLAGHGCCTGG